ncbi:Y-family DNA polymerase [Mucilaginibacter psychrotolerans]|uniref:DNA polymerase Y family protein n=1 Tax=Mucilaginibacter psychrotolerans TaxID=1524096 RepID=A0A4Y8S6X1_9SPHI|nr:DNA polymerase Y family protein [Mucilaginibacter psychrotolerans]TFF34496.1 DNA polymerase Y family protein [Mucilaginibacter psychrotolerans]
MEKRYMAIWFRHLLTDWLALRRPELKEQPFVIAAPERNRMTITATSPLAEAEGIHTGMAVADAKACSAGLQVIDEVAGKAAKLLRQLGLYCIRYSPIVAVDLPDGLLLDISGCAHLWGGEREYLKEIVNKLRASGYDARAAIADTAGAAWAVSRFGKTTPIIPPGKHADALLALPPAALQLDSANLQKLQKLGFHQCRMLMEMPRPVLRRRFGEAFMLKMEQALGIQLEVIMPLLVPVPYQERLPCLEPVKTAKAIEIAIENLLQILCGRLKADGKGVRKAVLKCYRIDGKMVKAAISTNRASYSVSHLQKLFGLQIDKIEPALGIELFIMEVPRAEEVDQVQESLWAANPGLQDTSLAELLDRLAGKVGPAAIKRYLPVEHHWPERSIKLAESLTDKPATAWRTDRPRPLRLLPRPEPVEVMAVLPDYPPKVFTYKGKRHVVDKADGPERIEREWWRDEGEHRDYYAVEDTLGQRYWLFRLGHYDAAPRWFIHGYFA